MNAKTQKSEARKLMITILVSVWPAAKLGKTSFEDLEWLIEIVQILKSSNPTGMSSVLNKYRKGYEDSTTAHGRKSKRCGDEISVLMTGLTGDQAIALAEEVCGLNEDGNRNVLFNKYAGLNEGSRKMNAANRIRGAVSRGDIIEDDIWEAMKHDMFVTAKELAEGMEETK